MFQESFLSPCQCVAFRVIEMNLLKKIVHRFWDLVNKMLTKIFTHISFFYFLHSGSVMTWLLPHVWYKSVLCGSSVLAEEAESTKKNLSIYCGLRCPWLACPLGPLPFARHAPLQPSLSNPPPPSLPEPTRAGLARLKSHGQISTPWFWNINRTHTTCPTDFPNPLLPVNTLVCTEGFLGNNWSLLVHLPTTLKATLLPPCFCWPLPHSTIHEKCV